MSQRKRLDLLLVERGLAESREKAQQLIRAGLVYSENERLEKPGRLIAPATIINVRGTGCPYVSRGGIKLAGALDAFAFNPAGLVAIDLGASTGGFTDCLLQRGARLVYAIDVGRGQLHERLLRDERVISREQTHIDDLQSMHFDPQPTLCVVDLSFISLRRALPVAHGLLQEGNHVLALVKPQFEVGRGRVPSGGVVQDERLQREVVDAMAQAAVEAGFEVLGRCASVITGGDGNHEFFLFLRRC